MNFQRPVRPVDKIVSKTVLMSLSLIVLALGVAIFSSVYMLGASQAATVLIGVALVWVGSMAFFYAVITEEHTMKQLFLRQSYFFTGLCSMILGMFFVSLAGLMTDNCKNVMEFGMLLVLFGAALTLLSLQKTRDYSRRSVFFALFGGILLMLGGIMVGSLTTAYAGVFIIIFSGMWYGLRDRYAV